jgi:hypothetical protein
MTMTRNQLAGRFTGGGERTAKARRLCGWWTDEMSADMLPIAGSRLPGRKDGWGEKRKPHRVCG